MTRPTASATGQSRPGTGPTATGPTATATGPTATGPTPTGTATYEIRVAGHLDDHWAVPLGDLILVRLDDGTTSLTGPVTDQAHLHGVLARIRDIGVPLLTVRTLDRAGTDPRSSAGERMVAISAHGGRPRTSPTSPTSPPT
jgi:hypothetical protein